MSRDRREQDEEAGDELSIQYDRLHSAIHTRQKLTKVASAIFSIGQELVEGGSIGYALGQTLPSPFNYIVFVTSAAVCGFVIEPIYIKSALTTVGHHRYRLIKEVAAGTASLLILSDLVKPKDLLTRISVKGTILLIATSKTVIDILRTHFWVDRFSDTSIVIPLHRGPGKFIDYFLSGVYDFAMGVSIANLVLSPMSQFANLNTAIKYSTLGGALVNMVTNFPVLKEPTAERLLPPAIFYSSLTVRSLIHGLLIGSFLLMILTKLTQEIVGADNLTNTLFYLLSGISIAEFLTTAIMKWINDRKELPAGIPSIVHDADLNLGERNSYSSESRPGLSANRSNFWCNPSYDEEPLALKSSINYGTLSPNLMGSTSV